MPVTSQSTTILAPWSTASWRYVASIEFLAPIRHPIVQYPQSSSVQPATFLGISSTCQPRLRRPFSRI
jgi:hypothetical protein